MNEITGLETENFFDLATILKSEKCGQGETSWPNNSIGTGQTFNHLVSLFAFDFTFIQPNLDHI